MFRMSVTDTIIQRLYEINSEDMWQGLAVDVVGEKGIARHYTRTNEITIHNHSHGVREAVRLTFVIKTVPHEFLAYEVERPSASVRLETKFLPVQLAECNGGAEKDPFLMRKNVDQFLKQSRHWEQFVCNHIAACNNELAVLLGEKQLQEPQDMRDWFRASFRRILDRWLPSVGPIDRERSNLRSHWMLDVFFREGVLPHFVACCKRAYQLQDQELWEDVSQATFIAERLANQHEEATDLAVAKLRLLRERANE